MSSPVDFAAAKRRLADKPSRLTIGVDKDGDLVLRLPHGPRYAVASDLVEPLLEVLLIKARAARYRKLGLPSGPPPERVAKDGPGVCRRARDGGLRVMGCGGCRRRRGHMGKCRDADGDYVPATCLHVGFGRTRVRFSLDGADPRDHLRCKHCNAEVPQ